MIRRRLITGTLSNCVGKVTAVGTWFFLTPFVLAELGTSAYALWVLVGAIASYGLLLEHGFGGAVVKYVAEHVARGEGDAARAVVASATWLYLALAAVAVLASAAIATVLPPMLGVEPERHEMASWLIVLTGINVGVAVAFTPASSVLRGLQRYDLYNGVSVINSLLEAAGVVVALLTGYGLLGMMFAFVVVNVLTGAGSLLLVARVAPDLRIRLRGGSMASIRQLASFSASLFAIEVAGKMQTRTDEFIIAALHVLSGVTPYALARKLGELSEIAAIQFLKVIMPLASELEAADQERKLRELYIVASRVSLAIAMPIGVVLMVTGGSILTLWVGPEYGQYGGLVAILAVATLLGTSAWPAVETLKGIARHRLVAITWLAAGAANIILSVLLLPWLGLMGVALGTLIPTACAALGVVMPFANRTLRVSAQTAMRQIWAPTVVPGMAAAVVLWSLHRQFPQPTLLVLGSCVAATMMVYAAGYLAMPASSSERRLLTDLVSGSSRRLRQLRVGVS